MDRDSRRTHSRALIGFVLLLALLMLFGAGKQIEDNTLDPDVFWHIRVGERLTREGVHPLVDDISYNSIREPWTPYSWLAEIVLARTWRAGGLRVSVMLGAGLIASYVALLGYSCLQSRRAGRRKDEESASVDGLIPVLAATAVGEVLAMRYLTLRPVTMAFVLIAVCVGLLQRDRRLGERTLLAWLVPPLVAWAVNLHFFAALVPLYVVCLLAGAVWEWRRAEGNGLRVRRYALLTLASLVACTATPLLGGVTRTVLHYAIRDPLVASGQIDEFRPFYEGAAGAVSVVLICSMLAFIVGGRHRARAGDGLAMVIGAALVLTFGRLMPFFVLTAAPLLAATIPSITGRTLRHPLVWAVAGVALLMCEIRTFANLPWTGQPDDAWLNRLPGQKGYPARAADYVLAHVTPRTGRIINEFGWGGYLSWRLEGRYRVMIDGRTQLYPPQVWQATYLGSEQELTDFLARTNADAAVLARDSDDRFEDSLKKLGWRLVYADARSSVRIPPPPGSTEARPAPR